MPHISLGPSPLLPSISLVPKRRMCALRSSYPSLPFYHRRRARANIKRSWVSVYACPCAVRGDVRVRIPQDARIDPGQQPSMCISHKGKSQTPQITRKHPNEKHVQHLNITSMDPTSAGTSSSSIVCAILVCTGSAIGFVTSLSSCTAFLRPSDTVRLEESTNIHASMLKASM